MTEFNADVVILMKLIENLSSKEIINLCSTSKKWHHICEKNKDTIWKRKLLLDDKIYPNEIIGNPKSYYLGLERNIGWYYFYSFEDFYANGMIDIEEPAILEVELSGQIEPEYDDNFFVPGIEEPKGEELLFAYFSAYGGNGGRHVQVIGKNVNAVLDKLIKEIRHEMWYDIEENQEVYLSILNLTPNKKFETNAMILSGIAGDIPVMYNIETFLYKVVLP